ncbi:hypothetical protein YC2023_002695 [Brassica napus]
MRLETGRVLLIYGTKSGEHKSDQTKPKRPHLTNIKWTPQSLTNANKKRGKRSIRASPMIIPRHGVRTVTFWLEAMDHLLHGFRIVTFSWETMNQPLTCVLVPD